MAEKKAKPQSLIVVGGFTIVVLDNGNIYIQHPSGEGMETTMKKFENHIKKFYDKEF